LHDGNLLVNKSRRSEAYGTCVLRIPWVFEQELIHQTPGELRA